MSTLFFGKNFSVPINLHLNTKQKVNEKHTCSQGFCKISVLLQDDISKHYWPGGSEIQFILF